MYRECVRYVSSMVDLGVSTILLALSTLALIVIVFSWAVYLFYEVREQGEQLRQDLEQGQLKLLGRERSRL